MVRDWLLINIGWATAVLIPGRGGPETEPQVFLFVTRNGLAAFRVRWSTLYDRHAV
jgi:hypothetical protein